MKKKIKEIKIQIVAGEANPAPPVGPALGSAGVNIMNFCKEFNSQTLNIKGMLIPTIITIYDDKTYDFILKSPPASTLIKQVLNLKKGSSNPNKEKVGKITKEEIKSIAMQKIKDLNTNKIDNAIKIIEGTIRSMGIDIVI